MWHPEVLVDSTLGALRALRERSLLRAFYLAGGTALALHRGHRVSRDLDFFSETLFDAGILLQQMQQTDEFSLVATSPHTLHAVISGAKVSFLGYAYPVLFPFLEFESVMVADPRDIACMKLSAIASRGTKRDFVDLYVMAEHFGLREILTWFARKYAQAHYSTVHLLKALTYFADAEKEPMPDMRTPIDWHDVQEYFRRESPRLFAQ